MSNQEAYIPYVPLTILYDKQGRSNQFIFDQIPTGSIIEIIRSDWKTDGTELDVSHLGFAVRTKEGLVYREASLIKGKVVDIPLTEYLRKYVNTQMVEGINIQLVLLNR